MSIGRFRRVRLASGAAAVLLLVGPMLASIANADTDISTKMDPKLNAMLPAKLKETGTIRVASNVEYPPFEYYDTDNTTIIGLDKDLADAIGQKLGVKLEFSNMSFDAIIPALAANRYDMAMSAMTDTEDRRKKVDFVDYFTSGGGFLVKQGNPKNIHGLADVCGITAAIDKGTTEIEDAKRASEDCVKAGKKEVNAKVLPGTSKIVLALKSGRVDVAMIDTSAGAYIAQQHKGAFEVPGTSYAPRPYGLVLPKDSDQLTKALQATVQALIEEGTYGKILAKWGQEVGAITQATINEGK
ncbi:polar amino acid transport system substrate-binding protein [Mesorhizobium soli]|uniref:ABC transporter substrate-binding protein n=1 Tax=Pseudaminobacter soli (ex Li et al. 2025) TaxID=1295366 RepID=UPI002474D1F4|nr:ABC transporter substrate-binding protein [Mesorhizobium soli]MDH6232246.1 polar amino acid transport system substrate-binding protein [Mesorhizobium soli]